MDFTAEKIGKDLVVKPVIERKGNDLIVHVPSFPLIKKLKNDLEAKDGKRNLQ